MAYTKGVIENYGVTPPENSKPLWGSDNPNKDDIITSIDFRTSLQKLDETEKEIIQLFNQGYSVREIASIKDINKDKVQRIKDSAIKKLRKMLNGEDRIYCFTT